MKPANDSRPVGPGASVEMTLSAEQVRVDTVRTAVEVVTVARRIVTETVQLPVQVRREQIVVSRSPAADRTDGSTPRSGTAGLRSLVPEPVGDLVITLRREVPVVSLDIAATERVTVHVDTVTEQRSVTTEVRREHAEVTTTGDLPGRGTSTDPI